MTRPAAVFRGTIHSFKTIPSRSVVSITVECPIEQLDDIARIAEHGAWVAVARLQAGKEVQVIPAPQAMASPDTGKPKREWRDLQPAAQCGIRCNEPLFHAFLNEVHARVVSDEMEAAEAVRCIVGVNSRVELGTNHTKRVLWHQLDEQFLAWKARENA